MMTRTLQFAVAAVCVMPVVSLGVTTYIGDVDGFGFGGVVGLNGADGLAADRNGNGILDSGDVLADLNGNGYVATGHGDDFDNRSTAEAADMYAKWTDVSLSSSYGGSPGLAQDAEFTFRFTVPSLGDPDYGKDHFVSFVYGDYDVDPMFAKVEGVDVTLVQCSDVGDLDGYISRAYSPVAWDDMLDGEVTIKIIAPGEPYVAFDYVELNHAIPAPGAIFLGALGASLVGWMRRRRTL